MDNEPKHFKNEQDIPIDPQPDARITESATTDKASSIGTELSAAAGSIKHAVNLSCRKLGMKKVAAIVAALVIVLVGASIILGGNLLDPYQRQAVDMVKSYKSMLKNPDSMTLRSDVTIVPDDEDNTTIGYFDAAGENGFGGMTISTPIFENGVYSTDLDEEVEINMDNVDEVSDGVFLRFTVAAWRYKGLPDNAVVIDGETVAKAAGVAYYG